MVVNLQLQLRDPVAVISSRLTLDKSLNIKEYKAREDVLSQLMQLCSWMTRLAGLFKQVRAEKNVYINCNCSP